MQLFSLFPVTCLVIICSTMFSLAPKWLCMEPKSPKALKTIYQVLKFAAKHKAPIYLSALTITRKKKSPHLYPANWRYSSNYSITEYTKVGYSILSICTGINTLHGGSQWLLICTPHEWNTRICVCPVTIQHASLVDHT